MTKLSKVKGPLHITVSLAIVRKHRNSRFLNIASAREAIKGAASSACDGTESEGDEAMRIELERRTGITIAQLATIAEHWPD